MLNRREFAAATTWAVAPTMLKAAGTLKPPPERSSYSIPAVQAWNPQTDQFAPYFPFGWYSFGPSARIEEIAENGANTALYAGMGTESWHEGDTLTRMDVAAKLGVKVVVGLRGAVVGKVRFGKPDTYGVIPSYVKTFNEHPAMLGWQLGDEFSAEAAPRINDTARLLRQLGSKHPTWQVHPHTWTHQDVRQLMARTDVCTYDGYTYVHGRPEFDDQCSARVLAWQQAKADLIQKEGWGGNVNVTQAVGCKCGNIDFRFPTVREYRWNVFSALTTAGARGTMNWIYSYWGGFYHQDPRPFFEFRDQVVKPVNVEQRIIARGMERGYGVGHVRSDLDQLTDTAIPPATGPHRKFNKVGHLLLRDDKQQKYFLLATNNEATAHSVRFEISNLPARLSSLHVKDPHRKRGCELRRKREGVFELVDRLEAFDVAIYTLG